MYLARQHCELTNTKQTKDTDEAINSYLVATSTLKILCIAYFVLSFILGAHITYAQSRACYFLSGQPSLHQNGKLTASPVIPRLRSALTAVRSTTVRGMAFA